nr:YggT family protein [uncultured Sphingomonas sp.]
MILALFNIILFLLDILTYVVFAQVILSWLVAFNVLNLQQPFVRSIYQVLDTITAPLYRPIRKILPDFGGLDFSPIILLILIRIVSMLVSGVAMDVYSATV